MNVDQYLFNLEVLTDQTEKENSSKLSYTFEQRHPVINYLGTP